MADELKPCPFCGGTAERYGRGCYDTMDGVECTGEDCHAGLEDWSREDADAAWNTRPIEASLLARAEAAEAKLEKVKAMCELTLSMDYRTEYLMGAAGFAKSLDAIMAREGGGKG